MQVFVDNRRAIVGIFLIVAGAAMWFLAGRRDSGPALALFQRIEAPEALRQLASEPRHVRAEVLRLALEQPRRVDSHPLTVALTQVDREEARALYESAIRAAVRPGAGPQTLLLAFDLIERWDVDVDAAGLADAMEVELGSEDTKRLGAAAFGIATVAPRLAAPDAANVGRNLAEQMQTEIEPSRLSLLSRALQAVAPKLSPGAAREIASMLVQRMLAEQDWYALRPLDEAVAALPEFDGLALANRLLDQAQTRADLAGVDSLLRAARALHDTPAVRSRASSMFGGRVHAGLAVEALAGAAVALGDFSQDTAELTRVAGLLVSGIEETRDPYRLALLASGLLAVGPGAPVDAARPLAASIGARALEERDPAALARIAVALHGVSHGWSDAEARVFADRVLAEMRRPRGEGHLRLYAVAMHAVADRAGEAAMEAAREIVRDRSTGEALEMSLLALGESAQPEEEAARADPRRLLDPTLPEYEWMDLARVVTGAEAEQEDPSIAALAGVEDDDGESGEMDEAGIDFNALSDALANVRPARPNDAAGWPPLKIAGLMIALLGAAVAASHVLTRTRRR